MTKLIKTFGICIYRNLCAVVEAHLSQVHKWACPPGGGD